MIYVNDIVFNTVVCLTTTMKFLPPCKAVSHNVSPLRNNYSFRLLFIIIFTLNDKQFNFLKNCKKHLDKFLAQKYFPNRMEFQE